jgi:hypothetical protein
MKNEGQSGGKKEGAPIGYEGLNLNLSLYVWFKYRGFSSRTLMSSNHSWKSSALTSDIPGGRVPLICQQSQYSSHFFCKSIRAYLVQFLG